MTARRRGRPDAARSSCREEHPAIAPLSFLLGRWKGTGKGDYPTIEAFRLRPGGHLQPHREAVPDLHQPLLAAGTTRTASQARRARRAGRLEPLAVETGFWRPQPDGKVEVLLSHPTGITEIYAGEFRGLTSIELVTDAVARTATAKPYTAGKRLYGQDRRRPRVRVRHGRRRTGTPAPPVGAAQVGLDGMGQAADPGTCGRSCSGTGSGRAPGK